MIVDDRETVADMLTYLSAFRIMTTSSQCACHHYVTDRNYNFIAYKNVCKGDHLILYFSILLHCIVQWDFAGYVAVCVQLYCRYFTVLHLVALFTLHVSAYMAIFKIRQADKHTRKKQNINEENRTGKLKWKRAV
jgi:hypothetical protein